MLLILKLKMISRESNIQIDTSSGYPEHELMNHYDNLHNKLIERSMKCMHRKYSDYDFLDKYKVNRTGFIASVLSFIDYIDINDSDSNDNIDNNKDKDKDDLNKILNELKHIIIENLKDYIKNGLNIEIINEIKTEIMKDLKTETNIK